MTVEIKRKTRREFFLGHRKAERALRPVGAISRLDFQEICTQCGECVRACPEKIIHQGDEGYPQLDLSRGGCTFCGRCTLACETGALRQDIEWPHRATVANNCLCIDAVQCRACQDHCDQQAIRFRLATGGRALPLIDQSQCTGCGACVAPCPVQAIKIQTLSPQTGNHP